MVDAVKKCGVLLIVGKLDGESDKTVFNGISAYDRHYFIGAWG